MKRAVMFLGVPVVVAIVLFILLLDEQSDSTTVVLDERTLLTPEPPTGDLEGQTTDPVASTDRNTDVAYPLAPVSARAATVERLADGDSFDIRWSDTGESDEVRLFGINAPEASACYGDVARDTLATITTEADLRVETIRRDEFGRVLANVWVEDVFVNQWLVDQGAALALSDGGEHASRIQMAMATARERRVGLWDTAFCGADEQAQIVIIAIEADAPGRDNENPNGEWIEVANIGEKPVALTDWSIRDESTRHRFFFPAGFELPPGGTVRVFSGCGADDAQSLYWCGGDPIWNNGGDTGFLVDPDGNFADSLSYVG